MVAPTKAAAVANAFFDIQAKDNTIFPRIDQLKLQKLLYYSHAWWLASKNDELFPEDVEAWPWGPVVRDIYFQFKDFGRSTITGQRAKEIVKTGTGILNYAFREPPPANAEIYSFLESVWATHKKFSGIQLSNATHVDGEPWEIVKSQYGSLDQKPRIPNELIQDVFKQKLSGQ